MILLKLCRNTLIRFFVALVIISSFLQVPAYSQESEDSQVFISGFNAFQQKNYSVTISKMNEVLQKYPDTPLRDMVLFWLSRSYYKNGNLQDAARVMSQFTREYPDNPLKGTVDEELLALTARYDKGEKLATGPLPAAAADRQLVAQKADDEKARLLKEKADKEQVAQAQVERERVAALKAKEVQAAAQAEQLRAEREKTELARVAALKAQEAKVAAAAESARLAAEKLAAERKATEAAEQLRLAAVRKEEDRKAALQVEQVRADREKTELARVAALQKEQERIVLLKAQEAKAAAAAESARLAAEKLVAERKATEVAEQQRLAAVKKEAERKATLQAEQLRADREKAELARVVALQKEQERIAALKAQEAKVAAAAESARLAGEKLAAERKATEVAEQQRLAAVRKEEERKAALQAEQLRADREKSELARLATLQKEQERLAIVKSEAARQSQEKAAAAKRAVEEAEQQKLAALKAEAERKASDKLIAEQTLLEKAEHEKLVKQQDEMVRLALAKGEQKRLAFEKAAEERELAEKAARDEKYRIIVAKAEEDRIAALAEEKRFAAIKAEKDRVAAEKDEVLRLEREKVEQARKAAAAESARLAAIQKEQELKAAARVEAERLAQEKAALAKRAEAEAEKQKLALLKKEQERVAATLAEKEQMAVAAAEAAKPVPVADGKRQVQQSAADEKERAAKAVMREKAIAQYKSILVNYPNTKASASAAATLKELGVAVALPVQVAAPAPSSGTAQVLRLEVAQFAGLEFNLLAQPQAYNVAQRVSIPFEITNQGNGSDSFYLESGFPAEFSSVFTSVTAPAQAINQTNVMAPGESFKGLLHLTIPAASIDGLRITHPVKASSRAMTEATQSREVKVIAAAPLLRAIVKVDRNNPLPGEKITYRVAVLNVGSTGAQDVTFRLNFPPQLEPVDYAASGFRQEMKAALVMDGLQLKSGESREFSLAFQLKDGSLAGQELLTRAELQNNLLKTSSVFVSTAAYVQPQHGLLVQTGSERLVVIPGQTVSVPFVVTNTGNVREKFNVVSSVTGAQSTTIFHDLNRDGVRQSNEPVITEVGPLAAKEEASIVMEIQTPRSATDGSEGSAQISLRSEGDASRSFAGGTKLVYSRPVLQMAMTGRDGKLKPGEVASFDLAISNRGSNLARIVELQSAWPEQLELVAADPAINSVSKGIILWKFKEVGAAEKRVIKVSFRVKPGIGVGTNIQVENILTYEDQIGNRY